MIWDVVVVGAGIAGLTCARRLQQAEYRVLVLEKSRGLGGRLATRRVGDQPIDHGCRYLEPTTPALAQLLKRLQTENRVQPWQPAAYAINTAGTRESLPAQTWFVAPDGMTAIPKRLAGDLTVWRQTRVVGLAPGNRWQLQLETAESATVEPLQTNAVVLAIPAPQALDIVQPLAGVAIDASALAALQQATFQASLTVMAGYPSSPATVFAAQPGGWMVHGNADTAFQWVGLDSGKRKDPQQAVVVVQSSDRFAQPYLNTSDLATAGRALLAQTAIAISANIDHPSWMQVHRWRYATVSHPSAQNGLVENSKLPLACCGDWCHGADVGAALQSGWDAADRINQNLLGKTLTSEIL